MATATTVCPSCGFRNSSPLPNNRCASCGAKSETSPNSRSQRGASTSARSQEGFSVAWFAVALGVNAVLTGAVVVGLPMVVPAVDFEGSAGMLVAIPVWFASGLLVGLIAPGKTFIEPVLATFLVAVPTALFLLRSQTVKTMPYWMYILMSALGLLFTLIGTYLGQKIQMGPPARTSAD